MFRSLVWTMARRLPGVWWAKSTTTKFVPSIVITIPRRMSLALIIMALRVPLEDDARSFRREAADRARARNRHAHPLSVENNRNRPSRLDHLLSGAVGPRRR